MLKTILNKRIILFGLSILILCLYANFTDGFADTGPLPSWNNHGPKKQIIEFIKTVTNPASKYYVKPEDRIATFDNDGTLWVEQPVYIQLAFAFDRVKLLAPKNPDWVKKENLDVDFYLKQLDNFEQTGLIS